MNRKKIAQKYIRHRLTIDIINSIPITVLYLLILKHAGVQDN
jgi:hypothetical protein